jgi:hypothetical protein
VRSLAAVSRRVPQVSGVAMRYWGLRSDVRPFLHLCLVTERRPGSARKQTMTRTAGGVLARSLGVLMVVREEGPVTWL